MRWRRRPEPVLVSAESQRSFYREMAERQIAVLHARWREEERQARLVDDAISGRALGRRLAALKEGS